MTELRIWQDAKSFGAAPPPPSNCVGIENIYISNSYCNVIILVHVQGWAGEMSPVATNGYF